MKSGKSSWGGARIGAGRPKQSAFVSHARRPTVGKKRPLLVTLKVRSGFASIRSPDFLDVFAKATLRARRFGLRIIHFSFLPNKIYLFCELKDQEQIEKSFKSLNTTLAIFIKKKYKADKNVEHAGPVFLGRYELKIIQSPEEARQALRDVLLAPAKHFSRSIYADEYSSAALWTSWKDLLEADELQNFEAFKSSAPEIERLKHITATPQFWLSQSGWRNAPTAPPRKTPATRPSDIPELASAPD